MSAFFGKIMKFLFMTDTHININGPKSRIDDYEQSLENKFNEMIEIAQNEKVDYILHGGDLFDKPDVTPRVVIKFGQILQKFQKKIYVISGNHDIFGYNPNTLNRSMLGILNGLGIVEVISKDHPIILEDTNLRIQVSAVPYQYDVDTNLQYYYPERSQNVNFHILMTHSMLLEKKFIDSVPHIIIDEIKNTTGDLVLAGHYHTGFGVIKLGNKVFVNPGSIARTNNSESERNRIPQVFVFEVKENSFTYHFVPLKSAKMGKDIFDTSVDIARLKNESLASFKSLIYQEENFRSFKIENILRDIAKNQELDDSIIQEALSRLGAQKDELY